MLPENEFALLSVVNTKLRDYYKSLSELCNDLNLDKNYIIDKLNKIGYEYNVELNQFK